MPIVYYDGNCIYCYNYVIWLIQHDLPRNYQFTTLKGEVGLKMTVAEVGNIVEFMDGLRGRVEKINDNSVIVDLTIMENFNDLDLPEKTVINHKRYKIVE